MSAVDTLNNATRDYIDKNAKVLVDTVFQSSYLAQMLRSKSRDYPGGTKITEHIVYAGSGGGPHRRGKTYTNSEKQTDQHLQFDPKFVQVPVTLDQIDIRVINQGPYKVYDILESKLSNAYLTMGAYMEIALYLAGSGASLSSNINGLAEICNDNSTSSFDGSTYSQYGELNRTDANWGNAIKGRITDVNGPITYETLESTYMRVKFGAVEPKLGQTTPIGISLIKNKFQTQQRFNEIQEPNLGFTGLKFNRAILVDSRYCPGSEIAGDTIAQDFVTEASADDTTPITTYPGSYAVGTTDETLWWLNTEDQYLHLYISNDKIWGLGFSDFIPSQTSDQLVGRVRLGWQITSPGTRYHAQLKRIKG
jgi:hypothetical protein